MPISESLDPNQHHKTKNKRGLMHPLSTISKQFVLFASQAERAVADMGCAYGNTVIAALNAGTKNIIACDMEMEHLQSLQKEVITTTHSSHLQIKQGVFPNGFDFPNNSLDAIHASHLFEYLNGEEVENGLKNCHRWLHPNGKLFILTYSIYILELANEKFRKIYARRLATKIKWPGYLEDYDTYCDLPIEVESNETRSAESCDSNFPSALHLYELATLADEIKQQGFIIEFAKYLDGKKNGAVEETWNDGREYIGIIAHKGS